MNFEVLVSAFIKLWTDLTPSPHRSSSSRPCSEPNAAVSSSIKDLLCVFPQWHCVPGTAISLYWGRAHFQHILNSLFRSAAALLLLSTVWKLTCSLTCCSTTHQHCTEALLQFLFRWHREFQPRGLFLGARRGQHGLALLPRGYLDASCCISHECISNRSKKFTYKKKTAPKNQLQLNCYLYLVLQS